MVLRAAVGSVAMHEVRTRLIRAARIVVQERWFFKQGTEFLRGEIRDSKARLNKAP